ncbi:MAG: hypothetical protein RR280_07980 [Bacteroidaceae bacterium]
MTKSNSRLSLTMNDKEDYSWNQELRDWERRQDNYERLGLNTITELDEEWSDGIPPEIQELIDWYKKD